MDKAGATEKGQVNENVCVLKSVMVCGREETDEYGRKDYRSVYASGELTALYVDVEGTIDCKGKTEQELVAGLFRLENGQAACVMQQAVTISTAAGFFRENIVFPLAETGTECLQAGIYGIVVQTGTVNVQSGPLYIMEGNGEARQYLRPVQAGIDKCCKETEEESKLRKHSFRVLDVAKVEDVRFYFMAENLLADEWVYEFTLQLTGAAGWVKTRRTLQGKQYVTGTDGKQYLCFAVDLGQGREHFWQEGEYAVQLFAFGQTIVSLNFQVDRKEVPYAYTEEVFGKPKQRAEQYAPDAEMVVKEREEVLDRLYRLIGLRKVKEEITRICEYADFIRMRRENGFSDDTPLMNMLFCGHLLAGKNTIAAIVGELFRSLGILSDGKVHYYERANLVKEGYAVEEQLVRKALEESEGGILFINDAGDLLDENNPQDRGRIALELLLEILMSERPEVTVILADTEEELVVLEMAFPQLKKCFPRRLRFEDYSFEEWMDIAHRKLEDRQFKLSPAADEKYRKWLKGYVLRGPEALEENFIEEEIEQIAGRMARRLMQGGKRELSREEMLLVQEEDIVVEEENVSGNSFGKLDSLVGARQLKKSIIEHLNYIYFLQERQRQGFDDVLPPLHMIFSGNHGTGKLTVAKMMGEIYYSAGILPNPAVLVQNAVNIATAANIPPEQTVSALINATAGGVLYLAEAGALLQTAVGVACFEGLLSYLSPESHNGMVIILADRSEEIDKMLRVNPDLKTYFPYQFDFRDYSREELLDIVVRKLKEKKYTLHPKAMEAFKELINKAFKIKDKHFGNAVWVEKLVHATIRRMSDRTMKIRRERELTRKELTTVMLADIPLNAPDMPEFGRDIFDEQEIAAALKELTNMVGQEKIKKQIREFVDLARHYSQQGIKLNTKMSLQWCFTGNSGMGKRAMARVIARLYKAMGIVEKNIVYDFKAEKLIGQTEEEAQRIVGDALIKAEGGILLFDEDSRKLNNAEGFRERVRAILANQMAERPGSCMVIYAGKQAVVQSIRNAAEKLSDIINVLCFEDYTADELMRILKRKLEDEQLVMTASVRQYMLTFIARLTATDERSRNSARLMRIVAELMIRNCMQRLAKNGRLKQMTGTKISVVKSDVEMFGEELIESLLDERKKIGFNKG